MTCPIPNTWNLLYDQGILASTLQLGYLGMMDVQEAYWWGGEWGTFL